MPRAGLRRARRRPDGRGRRQQRAHPARARSTRSRTPAPSRSTTSSSSCSSRSTRERDRSATGCGSVVLPDRAAMGQAAADHVAERLRGLLAAQARVRVIFAAAASQDEFLDGARPAPRASTGPASRRSISTSTSACRSATRAHSASGSTIGSCRSSDPGRVELIDGGAPGTPTPSARRYGALHRRRRTRPGPASGSARTATSPSTTRTSRTSTIRVVVKPVEIDDTSRHQQVRDGAFPSVRRGPAAGDDGHDVDDPREPRDLGRRARARRRRPPSRGRSTARSRPRVRHRRCAAIPMPCCSSTKPAFS